MKMVRSLLLGSLGIALTSAALALPASAGAASHEIAPLTHAIYFDASPLAEQPPLIQVAAPEKQTTQRQKFSACARQWAAYKTQNNVSGRAAYRTYMSQCLKAEFVQPDDTPAPVSRKRVKHRH